jgi:hypothetical protein
MKKLDSARSDFYLHFGRARSGPSLGGKIWLMHRQFFMAKREAFSFLPFSLRKSWGGQRGRERSQHQMFSNEDHEQRTGIEAPARGECFCHLLKGHPHASLNDMCSVCTQDYEAWALQQDQAAALAKFDAQWARLVAQEVN